MNEAITFEHALRNSRAFQLVKNDMKTGLSHAYMVVSPDDEAVGELFRLIAATIYCKTGEPCLECNECSRVLHYNHPNVFWINLQREIIKVESIKDLTASAYMSAYDDTQKLYLMLRADKMNDAAQNKLLKTLEEPPQGVTIFLGVSNSSAVKDTIVSRCRTINLDQFSYDVVKDEIFALTQDENLSSIAAACSEGELGKAHKIALKPDYAAVYRSALDVLQNLNSSADIAKYISAEYAPKNIDDFLDVFSLLLRDVLVVRHAQNLVLSKHLITEIMMLSPKFSERAIVETQNKITEARKKLFFNISATTVLEGIYFSMLEARHKWQQ